MLFLCHVFPRFYRMKPILLQAHERSLTKILYNKDGDLLFTASKHNRPNVWWSINGERLGTYNGHNGTIWDMAVSSDSSQLITASADQSCIIWDCETGEFFLFIFSYLTATSIIIF
jgi:translation initiation factor 3 subunit I